jgi:predicted component of type VI protein secretion system
VVDKGRRTMRHNDVPFLDRQDEINLTVSRAHAHIEFSPRDGEFRLYDDGSAQGTRVIRDGRYLDVPRQAGRGVKLRHGDELELGRARLRFLTRWE